MKSKLVIIAAVGENLAIGKNNRLPWHLPADLTFFMTKTLGKPLIMGYNTFRSLGNKPLKQRYNIVISDHPLPQEELPANLTYAASLAESLELASKQNSPWIMSIGGGQIYRQTLPLADEMYLTEIAVSPEADVFFPQFNQDEWRKTIIKVGESNGLDYRIVHYVRLAANS